VCHALSCVIEKVLPSWMVEDNNISPRAGRAVQFTSRWCKNKTNRHLRVVVRKIVTTSGESGEVTNLVSCGSVDWHRQRYLQCCLKHPKISPSVDQVCTGVECETLSPQRTQSPTEVQFAGRKLRRATQAATALAPWIRLLQSPPHTEKCFCASTALYHCKNSRDTL